MAPVEFGAPVVLIVLVDTKPAFTEPGEVELKAPVDTFGAVDVSTIGVEDLATEVLESGESFLVTSGATTVELVT